MVVELVRDIVRFRELKDEWNNLLAKSELISVFLTWEWLYYWWIHFKADKELFILLIKDKESGKLLGIAPFCIQKKELFNVTLVKKIMFLGTEKVASDFLDFIIYPESNEKVLETIYKYLDDMKHTWDIVEVGDIDKNASSIKIIRKLANKKYLTLIKKSQICPYVKLPQSHALLLESLSSKMRSNLKRSTKQIGTRIAADFSTCTQKEQVKENIEKVVTLHNTRFKEKHGNKKVKSAFSGDVITNFHYEVAESFFANNWLKFYSLTLDNKIAASLYGFLYKNRLFYYQSGINPEWRNFGIGNVLYSYCLENCINSGLTEFHFLRGNENYKFRWTKEYTETINFFLCNRTLAGKFLYYFIKIKMIIRKFPKKDTYGKRNNPGL